MKVICDNCGAMYKIPDAKLVKPVNKATCRQCGHRMLIPRPRRGADPDERTLVTAVPPTPPPAPSRSDSGPPTTPIHEPEEKTAPTGGRRTEETRWVRNDHPDPPSARPQVQVGGSSTAQAQRPQSNPQAKIPSNAFDDDDVATQVGPDPTLTYTPREDDETPPAPGPPPTPSRPIGPDLADDLEEDAEEPSQDTPPPAPKARKKSRKARSKGKKAAGAHDPRGDLGLAVFGVLVALLGIAILGVTSVIDVPLTELGMYAAVLGGSALGLMLAVGGGVGAFLVLVTGGRGSRPAWRVASILVAILLALLIGALPAAARVGYDVFALGLGSLDDSFGQLMAERPTAPLPQDPLPPVDGTEDGLMDAEEPPTDGDAAAALSEDDTDTATDEATDEDAGGVSDSTDPDGDDGASSSGSGTSGRTSGTTRTGRSSTGRTSTTSGSSSRSSGSGTTSGADDSFTEDEELMLPDDPLDITGDDSSSSSGSSAPASDLPVSPPLTAIDVMVKSNTGVKRCFFEYQKAEGSLPKRVDVKFTIKPDGDATSISTTQRKLSGTELESCLIRSIRSITFPPSQKGTTLTFPFVFG